jgi:aryl-alcohol dehydrogenase-like predicted oxidoreductase
MSLSTVGLGGFELGGSEGGVDVACAAIDAAVACGVNWLDTAEAYFDAANEQVIGTALRRVSEPPLVSSKRFPGGANFRRDGIASGCEASLARLGVDHLDMYFLHWPDDDDGVPIAETWGAMGDLVTRGLVRAIGLSNFSYAQVEACHAEHRVDVVQDGLSALDYLENREQFGACARLGIGVVVYEPLAGGLLGGSIKTDADTRGKWGDDIDEYDFYQRLYAPGKLERSLAVVDGLAALAASRGCTVAQLAVAWVLAQRGVASAICGSRTPGHIAQNAAAADINLDAAELNAIEELIPLGPTLT